MILTASRLLKHLSPFAPLKTTVSKRILYAEKAPDKYSAHVTTIAWVAGILQRHSSVRLRLILGLVWAKGTDTHEK